MEIDFIYCWKLTQKCIFILDYLKIKVLFLNVIFSGDYQFVKYNKSYILKMSKFVIC